MKLDFLNMTPEEIAALPPGQLQRLATELINQDATGLAEYLENDRGWKIERGALACLAVAAAIINSTSEEEGETLLAYFALFLRNCKAK